MAFRIMPTSRDKVLGPPEKWRPRALTAMEKIFIIMRQRGKEPGGAALDPLGEGVQFDHHPAIQRRRWDPVAEDTIPASSDLAYIFAVNKQSHSTKTAKSDIPEISKTRRLEAGPKKAKGKIRGRSSFGKR